MFYMSFKKRLSLLLVVTIFNLPTLVRADEAAAGNSAAPVPKVHVGLPKELMNAVNAVETAISDSRGQAALGMDSKSIFKDIQTYSKNYNRLQGLCGEVQAKASWFCAEKTAPNLQDILNTLNSAGSAVNMSGILDNCSALGKTASLVNNALTAYTAACSAARGTCTATCGSVKKSLTALAATPDLVCIPQGTDPNACMNVEKAIKTLSETIDNVESLELKNEGQISIAGKSKACNYDYGNMISSATMGMIQMVNSMKQAQQCKDQADGNAADKCLDPEVAKTDSECICRFHPRTAGCASAVTSSSAAMEGGQLAASTIDKKKSNGLGPSAGIDDSNQSAMPGVDGGGAGLPGAPTGGGGSGISSSGGGGSGGEGAGGATGTPLNAKVVNGFSGGGGSGFGGGRSSASYDGYRAYLPGGKKDPATAVGGQELWKKEVTGQAGKSNWDKVRDRYRDNRSTLIDK